MTPELSLCKHCALVRIVTTATGSTFYLCQLAAEDSRFAKYPPQPVVHCAGYSPTSSKS